MGLQYLISYYWAIQTVTTVGFGDFPARTVPEMTLSVLWMIFGVGFYSYVMGNFSSMLSSLDSEEMKLRVSLILILVSSGGPREVHGNSQDPRSAG